MLHILLFQWLMVHICIVGTLSQTVIRGVVGQAVTLPCTYSVQRSSDLKHMCWGQGSCPNSKCSNEILSTDGRRVVSRKSYRYNLNGYVTRGDVSLTIANLNEEDKGIYCCRIEVQGWFNDLKKNLKLQVVKATTTASTTTITTKSHMITTTVTIAPLTTAVTHPITSPFLSTTNPALPTTSTATSVPTMAPSSASTAIAFLTTAPSFISIKPSQTTLQDLSTKDGCSSFTTETAILSTAAMALPTTLPRFEETENADNCTDSNKDCFSKMDLATASPRNITTVSHWINASKTRAISDFWKKYYPVLIPCAVVLSVLLLILVGVLVKRKRMKRYQLDKMKSLIKPEDAEQTPAETEGENGLFPL